jgi:hypothetical protein
MLSNRRNKPTDSVLFLAYHHMAMQSVELPGDMQPKDLFCLAIMYELQRKYNDFVRNKHIAAILGETEKTIHTRVRRIKASGSIESVPPWNVTAKGEYLIRAYQIEFNRIINDTPLSRWRRIREGDKRVLYLRKRNTKGIKLY